MSSITSFISELVRAANEVERLNSFTVSRLLTRALVTIKDLREEAGIPREGTELDALNQIRAVADAIDKVEFANQTSVLLSAADMIRTLHIVIESGVKIHLTPVDDRIDR